MRELLKELIDTTTAGRGVVYCRLVETRGSAPQKAGAAMLVYPDGSQAGTLGGGCIEAEVKRRALAILESGKPEVVSFSLDGDYGWDDGLICGGRMTTLVDPLSDPSSVAYFSELNRLVQQGAGCSEAVVFDQTKSGLEPPASYLFDAEDRLVAHKQGPLVDGQPPQVVRECLGPLASRPRAKATRGVAHLPILPRSRLLIVGGGHIGQAVGNMAADLDFDVWVVDDREFFVSKERFPNAQKLICAPIDQALKEIEVTRDTYCLIVTRGHNHDEEALFHLVNRPARYVGMIGSRRKIRLIFDDLLGEGVSAEALARVHAPVGIDIGSQTVPEIAVSIVAELIAHRNLDGDAPGRGKPIETAAQ